MLLSIDPNTEMVYRNKYIHIYSKAWLRKAGQGAVQLHQIKMLNIYQNILSLS